MPNSLREYVLKHNITGYDACRELSQERYAAIREYRKCRLVMDSVTYTPYVFIWNWELVSYVNGSLK